MHVYTGNLYMENCNYMSEKMKNESFDVHGKFGNTNSNSKNKFQYGPNDNFKMGF